MDGVGEYTREVKNTFYDELNRSGLLSRSRKISDGTQEGTKVHYSSVADVEELKRKEDVFESKIHGSLMTLDDYYEYIKFKKDIFAKVGVRGKGNLRARYFQHVIKVHINKLYLEALGHFEHDLNLWSAYIRFCKIAKYHKEGSDAYKKILTFHNIGAEHWIEAAQWEIESTKNMKKGQNLLLAAIHKYPDHEYLYIKMLKELLPVAKSEESADYGLALAVYKTSTKRNFPVEFWAKALQIAEEFPYTQKLQMFLLGDIVQNFIHTELAWHILAQREYRGFPNGEIIKDRLDPEGLTVTEERKQECIERARKKYRFELCAEVYQAACQTVNTEQMWTFYIEAMVKINKDLKSGIVFKRGYLVSAFAGALKAKRLSEYYFREYVELLREKGASDDAIFEVVKQGPDLYPNSAMPWELLMHRHMIKDEHEEIRELFEKACREMNDSECAFPLWQLMIRYYQIMPDKYDYACELFTRACHMPHANFLPLRSLFLEYTLIERSIEQTRWVYDELAPIPPPYLPLHKRMALLESAQINPNIPRWRKCHRNAVNLFGKKQADVWTDFMDFEKYHGDPTKIRVICDEATSILESDMDRRFEPAFTILNDIKRIETFKGTAALVRQKLLRLLPSLVKSHDFCLG